MKARLLLLLITLFFFFSISSVGFAQSIETKEKAPRVENNLPSFFFGFSYIKPIGEYANTPSSTLYGFQDTIHNYLTSGASFEVGQIVWFEELVLPEDVSIGAKIVYISPQFIFERSAIDFSTPFFFLDAKELILASKVGPAFSYRLGRNLFLETAFLFEPSLHFMNNAALLIRYNPQISLRFKPFYFGFDFSFGRYKYGYNKRSVNQMRITFGINF